MKAIFFFNGWLCMVKTSNVVLQVLLFYLEKKTFKFADNRCFENPFYQSSLVIIISIFFPQNLNLLKNRPEIFITFLFIHHR